MFLGVFIMSKNNILEPVINAFWDVGMLLWRCIFGESKEFNFDKFFKNIEFKNKKEIYPSVYKKYKTDIGTMYLITVRYGA